jgi:hypothetical protein
MSNYPGYREVRQFEIHQHGEIIPEGEFETEAEAIAAIEDLNTNLGWIGLQVVENTVLMPE